MKTELIEALKNNEKPFGLMSTSLQRAATKLGMRKFEYVGFLNCDPKWYGLDCSSWDKKTFDSGTVYRLKADYQPEPEIVEVTLAIDCDRDMETFEYDGREYEFKIVPSLGNTTKNMPTPYALLFKRQK